MAAGGAGGGAGASRDDVLLGDCTAVSPFALTPVGPPCIGFAASADGAARLYRESVSWKSAFSGCGLKEGSVSDFVSPTFAGVFRCFFVRVLGDDVPLCASESVATLVFRRRLCSGLGESCVCSSWVRGCGGLSALESAVGLLSVRMGVRVLRRAEVPAARGVAGWERESSVTDSVSGASCVW